MLLKKQLMRLRGLVGSMAWTWASEGGSLMQRTSELVVDNAAWEAEEDRGGSGGADWGED